MSQHPGQVIAEGFLMPLGISANQVAEAIGVNRSTMSRLLAGKGRITPQMAARLGAYFQVPARWWLLMQAEFDAAQAESNATWRAGVTPAHLDPSALLTPKGVLRLERHTQPAPAPLSLSMKALKALPQTSAPALREVQQVRYENGAVALVGVQK